MIKTSKFFVIILLYVFLFGTIIVEAAENPKNNKSQKMSKITTNDHHKYFTINNIFNFIGNRGDGSNNVFTGNSGLEWPKGSTKTAIFEDGLIFGGYFNGSVHVGGSAYRYGWQAGRIIIPGSDSNFPIASAPNDPKYRVYVVRPDVNPNTPLDDKLKQILETGDYALTVRYDASASVQKIYDQYIIDWNEWPTDDGAPYTDVDNNGKYNPSIDIPGVPGADQTLWHVSNDLDKSMVNNLYGSDPVGIEFQRTIWGYNQIGVLGNLYFTKYKLINKSGKQIDSMYVSMWSDPDLGNADDDFVGCDTALSLGFVYNGKPNDVMYGSAPPSAGYDFVQGPLVKGNAGEDLNKNSVDDAVDFGISNGKKRGPGLINLPMSSFNFFINGNVLYTDPTQGQIAGTTHWYNLMRGLITTTGAPNINPITGKAAKFAFNGDPVNDEGWTDGKIYNGEIVQDIVPGDRRLSMSTGPFTFAAGDTQEIIVATLAAQGTDRLNSVAELKRAVSLLKDVPPIISLEKNIVGQTVTISVTADVQENKAVSVTATLLNYNDVSLTSVELFDDGNHNDHLAKDGIFGGALSLPLQAHGVYLNINEQYSDGHSILWKHVLNNIPTATLHILSPVLASDNINNDGIVNAGEIVRFTFSIHNESPFLFSHLNATARHSFDNKPIILPDVAANNDLVLSYNQNEPSTYLTFSVPSTYTDSVFSVKIIVSDTAHNTWSDTLKFSVKPLQYPITNGGAIAHNSGLANNDFKIIIVDPTKIKKHTYTIQGVDSINPKLEPGYSLKDSTSNSFLVVNNPIDWTGNVTPVIDGFKILAIDSMGFRVKLDGWFNPHGENRFVFSPVTVNPINDFNSFRHLFNSDFDAWNPDYGSPYRKLKNTIIKLANTDEDGNITDPTNVSYGYRYVRNAALKAAVPIFAQFIKNKGTGFAYQDYVQVPFAAWDIDDPDHPRRLMVGFLENNTRWGNVEGKYWPPYYTDANHGNNITAASPREWLFIFDKSYSAIPDSTLQVDILSNVTPIMWFGVGMQQVKSVWTSTDEILLLAHHTISSNDVWTFNPTVTLVNEERSIPEAFALFQNYPNPFNPVTTVKYSLPATAIVSLKVYDVLGREVAKLVENETKQSGTYQIEFNGSRFASGVYFYRLIAGDFISTKKMMVLK